ncbi:MAG: MFS transporter [Pseudomonadota bacterium]|nr:MFS transporter [Pseudomonadota bacterium]
MVAFSVDFVAVGFFFYSYGVFFNAIAKEFGGSHLGASLGLTVTHAVGAVAAPMVGRALDRFPLRRVIAVGAVSMSTGFLLLSQVNSLLEFYLVLGVFIGFGASSMGNLATSKLVTNWFDKRRGTALGIAASGVSLSGVVMPNVSAQLIENFDWRIGFMVFGFFTLCVVVPLVLRLVISRPEDVGMRPDGALPKPSESVITAPPRIGMRDVVREYNFWVIVLTFSFLFCSMSATLTHMIPRLVHLGHSLVDAAGVMSLCAGLGVLGKLGFGWIADRQSVRRVVVMVIILQFTGQSLMYASDEFGVFSLGAAIFGLGVGGVVPMHGAIVAATFGRERFGAILGLMRPAMFPIQILGVPFAGWVYDVYQSYDPAFAVFLGLYLCAATTVAFYRAPRKAAAA